MSGAVDQPGPICGDVVGQLVQSGRHRCGIAPRKVVDQGLAVELASALAELVSESVSLTKNVIGNRDSRLHTKSITTRGGLGDFCSVAAAATTDRLLLFGSVGRNAAVRSQPRAGEMRAQPGFPFRVLSLVAFSASLAVSKGATYAVLFVAASLIAVATVGFVYWRRWGR